MSSPASQRAYGYTYSVAPSVRPHYDDEAADGIDYDELELTSPESQQHLDVHAASFSPRAASPSFLGPVDHSVVDVQSGHYYPSFETSHAAERQSRARAQSVAMTYSPPRHSRSMPATGMRWHH